MTPRDARKAGASWGLSLARAIYHGPPGVCHVLHERADRQREGLPAELRDPFENGLVAAWMAEMARLEGTAEA